MCNRVNNLEIAFSGDDYQAVHRPVSSHRRQRVALEHDAYQLPQNARLLTITSQYSITTGTTLGIQLFCLGVGKRDLPYRRKEITDADKKTHQ